jgi:2-oxoisovalerate dehydrogenase E1 component
MALVDPRAECAAYDVNAACSGYLYALQNAYDMLQQKPGARILVVTTEVLSPLLDETDYTTAILFGDAATASLLCGEQHIADSGYRLQRPSLSGQADAAGILTVPHRASGETIRMDGGRVFSTGVRKMTESLRRALDESGRALEDIELVVPHQANQRIMNAIVRRLGLPPERFFSNIRHHGNTSSNSIPLALIEVLAQAQPPRSLALTAFGGGFTYGACLLDRVDPVEG